MAAMTVPLLVALLSLAAVGSSHAQGMVLVGSNTTHCDGVDAGDACSVRIRVCIPAPALRAFMYVRELVLS